MSRTWEIEGIREKDGFKFIATRGAGQNDHASWWSFYDEQVVRDRWWHPRAGDVVLDVGAAFGSYALPALAAGAKVVCFNPADFDAELLQANIDLNPAFKKRFLLARDGVHERDGWFDPEKSVFYPDPHPGDAPPHWLRVRSLDSWLAERPGIDRVDWVKLDVEGAELGALKGAEAMLRHWRPRLSVELHEFHVPDMAARVWSYLDGLRIGYRVDGPVKYHSVSHALYSVE